jgi:hypothetical protein
LIEWRVVQGIFSSDGTRSKAIATIESFPTEKDARVRFESATCSAPHFAILWKVRLSSSRVTSLTFLGERPVFGECSAYIKRNREAGAPLSATIEIYPADRAGLEEA